MKYWIIKYFSKDFSKVIAEGYYDTKENALKRNGEDANSRIISMHECTNSGLCGSVECKCFLEEALVQ